MLVETETIYCEQCRNLQDCVVGRFGESAVPTAPLPLRCRRSKSHAVRLWNAKEPCPRCGQRRMVAGKGMCEWD